MIEVRCECGSLLRARDEHAGKVLKCPKCGGRVRVPADDDYTEELPPPRARPPEATRPGPPARRPRDEYYDDDYDRPRRRPPDADYDDRSRRRRPDDADYADERPPARRSRGNPLALVALLLGAATLLAAGVLFIPAVARALGVFTYILPALFALPALVLASIGLAKAARGGKGLAVTGLILGGVGLIAILPLILLNSGSGGGGGGGTVDPGMERTYKLQTTNNLKQFALSFHAYNDNYKIMPPGATYTADGRPALSWRVLMLPYIEQGALYQQFRFDEPWDGPNNIKLLDRMPKIYQLPGTNNTRDTHYQIFYSKGLKDPNTSAPFIYDPAGVKQGDLAPGPAGTPGARAFRHRKDMVRIPASFPDGLSNTILIAEAANPVPWTKPDDLYYEPDLPLPKLGGYFSGGFHVALADGSVRFIRSTMSEQTLRLAIQPRDGIPFGPDWDDQR
jgi:hypothetical protein